MSRAYYNEIDPKAAAWLRELVARGLIAPGDVDERDIRDVKPAELMGYTQCHFFAGIGTWSYALRRAGWADDRQVWTGSCPCQPFSTAGRKRGTSDERHLWPHWFHLIRVCRPRVAFGEQVASKDGITWLDTVSSDLEGEGYACGPVVLPACGVGAPHKRDRLFFVADSDRERQQRLRILVQSGQSFKAGFETTRSRKARIMGDSGGTGAGGNAGATPSQKEVVAGSWRKNGCKCSNQFELASAVGDMGFSTSCGREGLGDQPEHIKPVQAKPVNGFWGNAEWIWCRDEKYRAVEPGSFPLAHGTPHRVGRLRGYGNGIVAQAAEEIIKAYLEQIG